MNHSGKAMPEFGRSTRQRRAWRMRMIAAILAASLPVAMAEAEEGTPKEREACTPDALNLCNAFIPDVERVKECLVEHKDGLSPACREVFEQGQKAAASKEAADPAHKKK